MAEVRYVFGNLLTGEVLEEIPMQGVTVNDSLDGGDFQGTFSLDQSGRRNEDLVSATIPGRCYVVVERDDRPFWCGIVWTRTYQSQAKTAQVFAKTFDQYPARRFIEDTFSWVDIEQRNIFRDLWVALLEDPNSPPINLPGSFDTVITKSTSVQPSDMKLYRTIMDELAATDDGFEWRVDVERDSGGYSFNLIVGAPTIGMPLSDMSIVFEYPGAILNYWRNDTISVAGTNIFGIGSGEGESMPVVEVVHENLLANGFPRWDYQVAFKGITDSTRVEALTQKQAQLRKAPMPVYTVQMAASADPAFGDWELGDYCKLVFKDALHEEGLTHLTRVLKYDYTPPNSEDVEEVRLTFEGDEGE
jgi:hypothetical protein